MEAGQISSLAADITSVDSAKDTEYNNGKEADEKQGPPPENGERRGRKKRKREGGKQLRPGERYVPPPKKLNTGVSFNQEHFDETSYYFEGGLRKVYPYYFDYQTYCKGRWIGKTLMEVFQAEFRAEPLEYYEKAVKKGRVRLNDIPVDDLNVVLKNNDLMRNTVHRHEPPVVGLPLEVIAQNDDIIVVDKPASLPVHPCGRYRHNTVIFILGKEQGLVGIHPVHRLDRLTSGVLLFGRTLEMTKRLAEMVRNRELEKEYVCRVDGEFPEDEVVCEEPILVVSFKIGVCRVDPKGKPSRTVFQRLSWNGQSSVVRCRPLTGRTHQIRVHLQFLGHPILNDPVYGSMAWGQSRAKGGLVGMTDEELLNALVEEHRTKESLHLLDYPEDELTPQGGGKNQVLQMTDQSPASIPHVEGEAIEKSDTPVCQSSEKDPNIKDGTETDERCEESVCVDDKPSAELASDKTSSGEKTDKGSGTVIAKDPLCGECKLVRPDPTQKELIMYLHALKYKGPDFEYSTCMPDWAKEDWVED